MKLFESDPYEKSLMSTMGSSSQYCLRWNNHQTNLLNSFESLLQEESFTDVTLACEDGVNLHAHRLVLAACSPYFSSLFTATSPQLHPIIVLKDVYAQEMRELLSYMYCGEVNVEQNRLQKLLKVAEGLRVKGLVQDMRSDDSQLQPLPLLTSSQSKAIPLLVNSSPVFNGNSSRSHSPSDTRVTPASTEGWEADSFHSRPLRSSSPRSPLKRFRRYSREERFSGHHPASSPPPLFIPHLPNPRVSHHSRLEVNNGGIRCVKDLYEKDVREISPRPSSADFREKRVSPFLRSFTTTGPESPSNKRQRHCGGERLVSPTPILRTALAHTHNFPPDVSSLVSLANSMIPRTLPPLLTTSAPSLLSTEDFRRMDELKNDRMEVTQSSFKKYEPPSDDDSRNYQDNPQDEEIKQEKICNGPSLSEYSSHNFHLEPNNASHFSTFASYVPAPKPEWKRYKQYTKTDLMEAIEAVKKGMTALQASRKYKVPSRTLYDKIKKMGINTVPRRLPFKKHSNTDLDPCETGVSVDTAIDSLRHRSPARDFFMQRPASREASESHSNTLRLQTLQVRTCLAPEDSSKSRNLLVENTSTVLDDSSSIETETRGSFSLVGRKVFAGENAGPLDLSDADVLTGRTQIEERA